MLVDLGVEMVNIFRIDREKFYKYITTETILLNQNRFCIVNDSLDCKNFEEACDRGVKCIMTVKGKDFSEIINTGEEYKEVLL